MEELTKLFEQLNLDPDIKELSEKAQEFHQELNTLGSKIETKRQFIEEVKECISLAKFSPKNIDRNISALPTPLPPSYPP